MNVYGSLYAIERPEKTRIVNIIFIKKFRSKIILWLKKNIKKNSETERQASLAHQKTQTYTEGSTFYFSNSPSKNQTKIE